MFLSDLSIRRPVLATMMILALVVLGAFSYRRLSVDQWPKVELPFLSIQTEYPGASPEAVEREVTRKIEEEVNSVEGVKEIFSFSNEGFSSIFIQFELDTKIMDALADVRSKIDGIRRELPAGIEPPVLSRFDPQAEPIMTFAVRGEGRSMRDLTRFAEEDVARRIQNIPGVGSVTVVGGLRREILVYLLPDRMNALGVSPDMVVQALRRENADVPAGRVERGAREDLVRIKGRIADPADFGGVTVLQRGGSAVRLAQVARIEDAQEEARDVAYVSGGRAVVLEVRKVSGGNTVDIADQVREEIARLNRELPAGVRLSPLQDNSVWIRDSVEDVQKTLVEGAALTILIVFLFLNSWRSTVITGLTLPVSVISSFLVFNAFGFTLNLMTLMALSLVIGILIDDAIVVRENIVRHVERGEDHFTAARRGTAEIGFAVLATSMSIICVFVPVAFMGGIVGTFFFEFGIVVAFAVLVSLFVSFTLDPMLSSRWYDPQAEGQAPSRPVGRLLKRFNDGFVHVSLRYRDLIRWALRHRVLTAAIATSTFVVALALVATGVVGGRFMPDSDSQRIAVAVETPVGSSLDYTSAKALEIVRYLESRPEVEHTYLSVGGPQHNNAVNRGQIFVQLVPRRERRLHQTQLETELRPILARYAGAGARIMTLGAVGGAMAPIQIRLSGPDIARLQDLSDRSLAVLRDVPGLVELKSSMEGRKPEWIVDVNRDLASQVGLSVGQIGAELRPVLAGEKSGDWEDPTGLSFDVRVRLAPEARTSAADLARIPLATTQVDGRTGTPVMVPLGQVAALRRGAAPDQIDRRDLERVVSVQGNYEGRALTAVVADARARLATIDLPPGYSITFGGEEQDFVETVGYMTEALALAVILLYLILASQFGSFLQPLAIMLSLPLSLIGVTLALALTRGTLNIMSMIGVIMLMGLVVKNAILLVDFVNQARKRGSTREQALVDAGELRLRPIVMTTLAMIFGMLPTAVALGSGAEFRAPMAHAVIGGLITSTLLTLIVVPVVYTWLDDLGDWIRVRVRRWALAPGETGEPAEGPAVSPSGDGRHGERPAAHPAGMPSSTA
jgi:HAE1 family hydrophobic/amphiphilic exporter-1